MDTRKKTVAGTMAASLALGGFALGRMTTAEPARAELPREGTAAVTTPSGRPVPSFASLAEQAAPAVVHIKVVAVEKAAQPGPGFGFGPGPFGGDVPFPGFRLPVPPQMPPGGVHRRGSGSGFIIRSDGVILTNNHVVEDAKEITVALADKSEYTATVLGRDPKADLAVLKIEPGSKPLPVARLGDSDALRVGDWVMAIGNPFGLSNTVTAGIVSAKGRVLGAGPYDDFIQTDAPINPGNSGGPLFNERGEVVGINSAIFSRTGGNIGIGFAIPINLAKRLVPALEEHGHVTRGWLGVAIQPVTPDLAKSLRLDKAQGALVAEVTADSPAEQAGITRGDVIVAYDGKAVEDSSALPALVAATPVGETVAVEVVRHGETRTLEVTVAELADEEPVPAEPAEQKGKWGLAVRELRPEDRERRGITGREGVLVA
ncbi:MAG: Do family serine endopeptidase, partial [Thermodesulfobacteriota bacterium]